MKRAFFYSIVLVLLVLSNASAHTNENPGLSYTLLWSDEFTVDGALDLEKWHHQTFAPNNGSWFNNEEQHYTDRLDNSYVADGLLKIVAKRESFDNGQGAKAYTSARLNSKFAFTYGKVDVRAKLPEGDGTWPAIWMLGQNINETGGYWQTQGFGTTNWPETGEIDIMEHWGDDPNVIHGSTHTPSSFGATINTSTTTVSNATDFHDYSIEWDADEIRYFVDDQQYYTYNPAVKNSDTWPFDNPQYLLLNVAMGGVFQGGATQIDPNFTESTMEIDYVRVYEETKPSSAPSDVVFSETFVASSSIDAWTPAGSSSGFPGEVSKTWNETGGNPAGALQLSGTNATTDGRAYIWEYTATGLDFSGISTAKLSLDVKRVGNLTGVSLQVGSQVEGQGFVNVAGQESLVNETTFTTLDFDIEVTNTAATTFKVSINLAAGAFVGAGGTIIVDNVTLTEAADAGDITPPVITLIGDATINLNVGDTYNEQGATASDDTDGDISGNIAIGGDVVDTNVEETYVITYNVSDAAGNAAEEVKRTVIVGAGGSGGTEIFAETFDDANSISGWSANEPVANIPQERELTWNETGGNPGGAFSWSGTNSNGTGGRAFQTQKIFGGIDFSNSSDVQVSLDIKYEEIGNANVNLQVEILTAGNMVDNGILSEISTNYSTRTYDFSNVPANASELRIFLELSVSGVQDDRAIVLLDNIKITSSGASSDAVTVPLDFESSTANYMFGDFEGTSTSVIDNPQVGGINTSAKVVQSEKGTTAVFAGTTLSLDEAIVWEDNNAIKAKVYSPRAGVPLTLKLESSGGDGGDREVVVTNEAANVWEELDFDFTGNLGTDFSAITLIWENGTASTGGTDFTFLIDDIILGQVTNNLPEPTEAAPTPPTRNAADVISLYSDAYTNAPGINYSADFDEAALEEIMIAGNNTLKYTLNPNFFAFDFSGNKINASAMTEFHMDFWTPNDIANKAVALKMVDFGGGSAESSVFELTLTQTQNGEIPALQTGTWISLDVPVSAFTGNTTRSDLAQFLVTFASNNTIYIDNVYLWKEPTQAGKDASLSDLQVDGTTIAGFSPAVTSYNVILPAGTTLVPDVTFTLNDANATAMQTDATEIPGTTTIEVTSQDATVTNTYSVNFINPVALPLDFETADQTFGSFNGASFALVSDPDDASNQVGEITNSGVNFEGISLALDEPVDFISGGKELSMQFNTAVSNLPVLMKFEGGASGAPDVEVLATASSTGWQELTFDFSTANNGTVDATGAYSRIVIFAAFNQTTSGVFLIDDITQAAGGPSNDASLSDIQVDGTSIEEFSSATLVYDVALPFGTTEVPTVTVTTSNANATAGITDATSLPGSTSILVTAEDATTTSTYTVNFTVSDLGTDATLSEITVNGSALDNFDAATLSYAVELPFGTTVVPTVVGTPTDDQATVSVTPAQDLPGTTSILVTAEDGSTNTTYTVDFTVAQDNDDSSLSDLQVDGATISGFSSSTLDYSIELPINTTTVPTVTATASDAANATIAITPAEMLPGTTSVEVTAENGTTTSTYTVAFTIAPNTDASLSDLQVDGATVSGFSTGTFTYDVDLPSGTSVVPTVTATATDANAMVTVFPATTLPGTANVTVTAEDGETVRNYSIAFTVADAPLALDEDIFRIYPNPATDNLSIQLSDLFNESLDALNVIDVRGNRVPVIIEKEGNELLLNVSALSYGTYYIQLMIGEEPSTIRFIKN
ncbi:MAG: family 16 glycosylhydrolase [Bacteroidota bacterium]